MNKISNGGLYLIADPSIPHDKLLGKLRIALKCGIAAIQLWNNPRTRLNLETLVKPAIDLCRQYNTPLIINNEWKLLKELPLDGVHFDAAPPDIEAIRKEIGRDFITGITCGNDLKAVEWAHQHEISYISFCSIFPSSSADGCELVNFETIKTARELTGIPIFLAGGLSPENLKRLNGLNYNGLAVISAIMNADDTAEAVKYYNDFLHHRQ